MRLILLKKACFMRILIVVRKITMGGLQKQALSFAQTAHKNNHEVHLMILKSEKPHNELEIPSYITVHRPKISSQLFSSFRGILSYITTYYFKRLFGCDVEFSLGYEYSRCFEKYVEEIERQYGGFDLIFFRGQGCFEYLHQFNRPNCYCFVDGKPYFYKNIFSKNANKIIYGAPKKFICVSEQLKKFILEIEKSAQVICSHNFLDFAEIRTLAEKPVTGLPEKYIVNVGRLVSVKSQELLIKTMPLLPEELSLVLVGDGKNRQNLQNLARSCKCEKRVIFAGSQNNPYPYIKHAKALVHTSQKEGFGMIFLESLILDTPVVATESIGGMRDILKGDILENQIVPRDPKALAHKITDTINNPYRSTLDMYQEYDSNVSFNDLLERLKNF